MASDPTGGPRRGHSSWRPHAQTHFPFARTGSPIRPSRHGGAVSRALHNYGLTADELLSGKPIIGIAQTGGDLTPCNRVHLETANAWREGIPRAGGVPIEFPMHPIFEELPSADRALQSQPAYLGLAGRSCTAIPSMPSC